MVKDKQRNVLETKHPERIDRIIPKYRVGDKANIIKIIKKESKKESARKRISGNVIAATQFFTTILDNHGRKHVVNRSEFITGEAYPI